MKKTIRKIDYLRVSILTGQSPSGKLGGSVMVNLKTPPLQIPCRMNCTPNHTVTKCEDKVLELFTIASLTTLK